MRVIFHPEAESEMIDSARFYERRVPGLGAEFLDAIDEAVRDVLEAPLRWRAVEGEVRRYLLGRFPFSLLYRVLADHLRILAVKHHSRHPGYWQERMED
jgi:plasmid stabilization system protein ParE